MLGELDFYLPKSFCSTNVYGEYTEGKNSIVGLIDTGELDSHTFRSKSCPDCCCDKGVRQGFLGILVRPIIRGSKSRAD